MITSEKNQEDEEDECLDCDNIKCKCDQIMTNLSKSIDLADQTGHLELYNILLTIFITLQHLDNHVPDIIKIEKLCQQVYKELNPKEMGFTLN